MQRIEWAVVSWTKVTQVMRIKIKLFHERPLLKRALQSLQRAQNDSIHKATSAILWMAWQWTQFSISYCDNKKKLVFYVFKSFFRINICMTFVKIKISVEGTCKMNLFIKLVPICDCPGYQPNFQSSTTIKTCFSKLFCLLFIFQYLFGFFKSQLQG